MRAPGNRCHVTVCLRSQWMAAASDPADQWTVKRHVTVYWVVDCCLCRFDGGIIVPQPSKYVSHAARQAAYRQRCEQVRLRELEARGLPASPAVSAIPGTQRWRSALRQAADLVAMVHAEMEDYFADRSEVWHADGRGDQFQERMDAVEQAQEALEELATQ